MKLREVPFLCKFLNNIEIRVLIEYNMGID